MLRNSRFFHEEKAFSMNAQNLTIFTDFPMKKLKRAFTAREGR